MNLENTIIPKSDQTNADDLITGPRTIKITAVNIGNKEQPVSIRYEGDDGRPYKPSKGMRRALIVMWGKESQAFLGRSLTIYRDPEVMFGKDPVGGIKISHASNIPGPIEILLTVSRGYRKPFTILPLDAPPEEKPCPLTNLPSAWLTWSNEEKGEHVATRGTADLEAWWEWIGKPARKELATKLDGWKATAEAVQK